MAAVLVATLGSWGDLFPLLGLASELRDRGHDVRVAASPAWAELIGKAGLTHVPVGRHIGFKEFAAHPEIFRPMPFGLRAALRRFLYDQIEEITEDVRHEVARADVVVAHPGHTPALNLAEAAGTTSVVATVFPHMVPSRSTVPGGSPVGPWSGRLGEWASRSAWAVASAVAAAVMDRPINRHRRALGLEPIRAASLRLPQRSGMVLILADPALVTVPKDWPAHVHVTGPIAWDLTDRGAVVPAVDEFLGEGDPPVLVTLGTSSTLTGGDFFAATIRALRNRGARVVAVTGPSTPHLDVHDDDVLVTDFVPFRALVGRCRAVIHHAGIGTTNAVLRAGIPQLVVPMAFDQPDTARMIESLGVGLVVPWSRRQNELDAAIERLLADDELTSNAQQTASRLSVPDTGAPIAADAIEAHLAESRS